MSYNADLMGISRRQLLAGSGSLLLANVALSNSALATDPQPFHLVGPSRLAMFISLYAADHLGLFQKHGLAAEITFTNSISLPVSTILGGTAEMAVTGPGMAVNAAREGASLKVIANLVGGVAMWMVARPGTTVTSLEDFKGKTIATIAFPSSTIQIPTYAFKSLGGFDPKEAGVTFLELPFGTHATAVKDGRADFAAVFEWDRSIAEREFGLETVFSFAELLGPLSWTTAMASEEYLQQNPGKAQSFCNAIAETQKILHSDEGLEVFVSATEKVFPELDRELIQGGAASMLASGVVPKNPTISEAMWETDMKLEVGSGSIESSLPYAEMVDNTFAVQATNEYGLANG